VQTIMATHDATDALALAAEVALIQEGHLAALGPALQVLASERKRLLDRLG
jgi:ABC-type sulfate/molybdate transport systems ATPase subunit